MRPAQVEVIFVNSLGSLVEIRAGSHNLAEGSALIKRFPERKSFLVERVTTRSSLSFKRSYGATAKKGSYYRENKRGKNATSLLCYVIRVCVCVFLFARRDRAR